MKTAMQSSLIAAALLETREKFSVWEGYLKSGSLRLASYLLRAPVCVSVVLLIAAVVDYTAGSRWLVQAAAFFLRVCLHRPRSGDSMPFSTEKGRHS